MPNFNIYITQYDYSWFIDFMVQNGTLVQYRKNEAFCSVGKLCKTLGFIRKGAFIYTAPDTEARRHVVGYAFENSFVGDYAAFRLREPANVTITALYDSEVITISNDELEAYLSKFPENQRPFLRITEILFSEIYQRFVATYTRSTEERYLEILQRCPDILQHTTAKHLASYLHVTPETLSRLRKKLK